MKFSKEKLAKLTEKYLSKTNISEIMWMMLMTNIMRQVSPADIDQSNQGDIIVDMKMCLPKVLLAGYLRAMDKTIEDMHTLFDDLPDDIRPPFCEDEDLLMQKTSGAFFMAGIDTFAKDNIKTMEDFIKKTTVEK